MEIKSIKGIDDRTWFEFKALAAKKRLPMGKMLSVIVEEYKKNSDKFWDEILNGEKILSDREARDMNNILKKVRKERGFRI